MLAFMFTAPMAVHAQPASAFPPETLAAAPTGKPWEPAWGFWPKAAPESWQQTHWGFVGKTKQGGVDVLFLGDSITKGWSGAGKEIWAQNYQPLKALNIGIGGDTTRQTLWRIEHEALSGVQPKVVVLMIGVNNIFTGTGDDAEIARGVEEIVKQLRARLPETKILLAGILPLGNAAQSARAANINRVLATWRSESLRFLDLTDTFTGPDGRVRPELYRDDLVHLAAAGYEAWDGALHPVLLSLLE